MPRRAQNTSDATACSEYTLRHIDPHASIALRRFYCSQSAVVQRLHTAAGTVTRGHYWPYKNLRASSSAPPAIFQECLEDTHQSRGPVRKEIGSGGLAGAALDPT
jgi:hypothetical protein